MLEPRARAQSASTGTMFLFGFGAISTGIKNNLLGYFFATHRPKGSRGQHRVTWLRGATRETGRRRQGLRRAAYPGVAIP